MPDVTLLEIARRLGVSKTAVSMALRGKPGLSAATSGRIIELARELGYTPNPVSAELMAMVRGKRHKTGTQTIAFLNTFMEPELMRRLDGYGDFVTGASRRAARYGYAVDVIDARAPGLKGARLAGILRARGIRGILVGPRWGLEPELEFPWSDFSAVLVGEPRYGQNLHRVCNHHLHACATALRALAGKGYRNIGVALAEAHEKNYGYDYLLGVDQFLKQAEPGVKVTSLLYEGEWDDAKGTAWIGRHGFDAVVSLAKEPIELGMRLRTSRGDRIGCAGLAVHPGRSWSGISQHIAEIGAAAVDMLRGLLLGGERGTAARPQILLLEGEWVEGETTPGPRPEKAVARRSRPVRG